MEHDGIDKLHAKITEMLRNVKSASGKDLAVNYTKFNEDMEFQMELTGITNIQDGSVRELATIIGNYGFVCGINAGVHTSIDKVTDVELAIAQILAAHNAQSEVYHTQIAAYLTRQHHNHIRMYVVAILSAIIAITTDRFFFR